MNIHHRMEYKSSKVVYFRVKWIPSIPRWKILAENQISSLWSLNIILLNLKCRKFALKFEFEPLLRLVKMITWSRFSRVTNMHRNTTVSCLTRKLCVCLPCPLLAFIRRICSWNHSSKEAFLIVFSHILPLESGYKIQMYGEPFNFRKCSAFQFSV